MFGDFLDPANALTKAELLCLVMGLAALLVEKGVITDDEITEQLESMKDGQFVKAYMKKRSEALEDHAKKVAEENPDDPFSKLTMAFIDTEDDVDEPNRD
jgi:hypothetical protein